MFLTGSVLSFVMLTDAKRVYPAPWLCIYNTRLWTQIVYTMLQGSCLTIQVQQVH